MGIFSDYQDKQLEEQFQRDALNLSLPEEEKKKLGILDTVGGLATDLVLKGTQQANKTLVDTADLVTGGQIPLLKQTSDFFQRGIEGTENLYSDAYRDAKNTQILTDEGLNAPSVVGLAGTIAESAAQVPQFLTGAGLVKAGLKKALPKLSDKASDALSFGAGNAALVSGSQYGDVKEEAYQENLKKGMSPEEAMKDANSKALVAAGLMAPVAGLTGGAGGLLAKSLGGESKSLLGAVGKGFAADAPTEGIEEYAQSAIADYAQDKNIDIQKASNAGLLGLLAGGAPGATIAGLEQISKNNKDTTIQDLQKVVEEKQAEQELPKTEQKIDTETGEIITVPEQKIELTKEEQIKKNRLENVPLFTFTEPSPMKNGIMTSAVNTDNIMQNKGILTYERAIDLLDKRRQDNPEDTYVLVQGSNGRYLIKDLENIDSSKFTMSGFANTKTGQIRNVTQPMLDSSIQNQAEAALQFKEVDTNIQTPEITTQPELNVDVATPDIQLDIGLEKQQEKSSLPDVNLVDFKNKGDERKFKTGTDNKLVTKVYDNNIYQVKNEQGKNIAGLNVIVNKAPENNDVVLIERRNNKTGNIETIAYSGFTKEQAVENFNNTHPDDDIQTVSVDNVKVIPKTEFKQFTLDYKRPEKIKVEKKPKVKKEVKKQIEEVKPSLKEKRSSLKREQVESKIKEVSERLKSGLDIQIINKDTKEYNEYKGKTGGDFNALVDIKNRKAVYVADKFDNLDDVESTVLHEIAVHEKIHGLMNRMTIEKDIKQAAEKYMEIMSAFSKNKIVKEVLENKINKLYADYNDSVKVEEALAEIRSNPELFAKLKKEDQKLINRFVAFVKDILAKITGKDSYYRYTENQVFDFLNDIENIDTRNIQSELRYSRDNLYQRSANEQLTDKDRDLLFSKQAKSPIGRMVNDLFSNETDNRLVESVSYEDGVGINFLQEKLENPYNTAKREVTFKAVFDSVQKLYTGINKSLHKATQDKYVAELIKNTKVFNLKKTMSVKNVGTLIFDTQKSDMAQQTKITKEQFEKDYLGKKNGEGDIFTEKDFNDYNGILDAYFNNVSIPQHINYLMDQGLSYNEAEYFATNSDKYKNDKEYDDKLNALVDKLFPTTTKDIKTLRNEFQSLTSKRKELNKQLNKSSNEVLKNELKSLNKEIEAKKKEINKQEALSKDESKSRERVGEILKQLNNNKNTGYFPLKRFGQYAVTVKNNKDEVVYFSFYDTNGERKKALSKIASTFPKSEGYNISTQTKSKLERELYKGTSLDDLLMLKDIVGKTDADKKLIEAFYNKKLSENSSYRNLMKRDKIEGFSEDLARIFMSQVVNVSNEVNAKRYTGNINELINKIPNGRLKDYAIKYVKYNLENATNEEFSLIRSAIFLMGMGFNVSSAVTNFSQLLFTGGALAKDSKNPYAIIMKATKQLSNMKNADEMLKRLVAEAEDQGLTVPQDIFQAMAVGQGKYATNATKLGKARNTFNEIVNASGFIFGKAEEFNRKVSFISGVIAAREKGLTNEAEIFEYAKNIVTESQFIMNKGNRPEAMRGYGTIFFAMKNFIVQAINQLKSFNNRQRAYTLLPLILVAGLSSLPFADDAEDVLETVMQRFTNNPNWRFEVWSKKQSQKLFKDLLGMDKDTAILAHSLFSKGIINTVTGVAVAERVGLGNLLPGTDLLKKTSEEKSLGLETYGVGGSMLKNMGTGLELLADGNFQRGFEKFLPVAFANLSKGIRYGFEGGERDLNNKLVAETSIKDALFKSIGFSSTKVNAAYEYNNILREDKKVLDSYKDVLFDKAARAKFDKDQKAFNDVVEEIKEWNRENPKQKILLKPENIVTRLKAMKQTNAERQIKQMGKDNSNYAKEVSQLYGQQ